MRIGVNTALLSSAGDFRQAGVSRYIRELLAAMGPLTRDDEDIVSISPGGSGPLRHPVGRIAWEQTALAARARMMDVDLLHGPVMVAPLLGPPSVVTVHDLAFVRYPEHAPKSRTAYLAAATRQSVHRARRVITVSHATASDLMDWTGLPADRIEAIPLAATPTIQRPPADRLQAFRRDTMASPYILAVGTIEPRKNLLTLLNAFASIADRIPHTLVIVGGEGWKNAAFETAVGELGLASRIRFTGHVPDAELSCWYSACDCFVLPSVFEGFGLPPLEAMKCGAPVVVSNTSSIPEVVGDAGLTVAPLDVVGFANALLRVIEDRGLRAELCARGVERAAEFSWTRTAEATLEVYRDAEGR
ncbi:glycosyltransferase family 1 protein [Yimella sp. RIT 621]|uniref:Glycosyltransferase involved in cell wall biosynthesis n=1 Tax=Yimella lutea TaxID=587872 RepID=A0A542EK78_9MICO|nr:glycosyltransferase family 1 protein [Yimella sp. RIT 621]TQJ15606.1 glycosyltransferase involved in cell wall biosynthesis [Yimella lutea]